MMRAFAWLLSFALCAISGAALAGKLGTLGVGHGNVAAGAASCLVLEVDGTSKLLLEDGSGCIALES
jgi:hypothetical protein